MKEREVQLCYEYLRGIRPWAGLIIDAPLGERDETVMMDVVGGMLRGR